MSDLLRSVWSLRLVVCMVATMLLFVLGMGAVVAASIPPEGAYVAGFTVAVFIDLLGDWFGAATDKEELLATNGGTVQECTRCEEEYELPQLTSTDDGLVCPDCATVSDRFS